MCYLYYTNNETTNKMKTRTNSNQMTTSNGYYRFSNQATAENFRNRAYGMQIVLMEEGTYLVTTNRNASKLMKAGYEIL